MKRGRGPARGRGLAFAAVLLVAGCATAVVPDPRRPQLTAAEAAHLRVVDYLTAGAAPWQPRSLGALAAATPDFVVAADGSGTHRSVQAAIDALPAAAPGARRYLIHVRAGTYREVVCARAKAPFALVGVAGDAAAVTLVEGRYNGLAKRPGIDSANPCEPRLAEATYGTAGSASVALFSDDIALAHVTIANDAHEPGPGRAPPGASGGAQAVALMTRGDRIQLEDVRLIGHQDTFYVRRGADGGSARVHVRASLIAGDVDFVFGDATLVIEDSTLWSRADRRGAESGGIVLAPSTLPGTAHGFLVVGSRFEGDPALAAGSVALGRAWDRGVAPGTWRAGVSPNGQALVRDSRLGPHIGGWAASTSRRSFTATGESAHRLAEFNNRPAALRAADAVPPLNPPRASGG